MSKVVGPFYPIVFGKTTLLLLLVLAVQASAIAVVIIKHLNRSLHIQLQQLQHNRDNLHVEWSRLLLEQGTLGSEVRVEKLARDELQMFVPKHEEIVVVRP